MVNNMDSKYIVLFKEMMLGAANLAEQVMSYNKEKGDQKGYETAEIMRNDYLNLHQNLQNPAYIPAREDFARLLVAAYVLSNNITEHIKLQQKALDGYKLDILPKLDRILNEAKTNEEAIDLANKIFVLENET